MNTTVLIATKQPTTNIVIIKSKGDTLANIVVNVTDYDVFNVMDNTIVGELGIESNYEEELVGVDGYTKYQQDKYGYKIPILLKLK